MNSRDKKLVLIGLVLGMAIAAVFMTLFFFRIENAGPPCRPMSRCRFRPAARNSRHLRWEQNQERRCS